MHCLGNREHQEHDLWKAHVFLYLWCIFSRRNPNLLTKLVSHISKIFFWVTGWGGGGGGWHGLTHHCGHQCRLMFHHGHLKVSIFTPPPLPSPSSSPNVPPNPASSACRSLSAVSLYPGRCLKLCHQLFCPCLPSSQGFFCLSYLIHNNKRENTKIRGLTYYYKNVMQIIPIGTDDDKDCLI